MHCESSLLQMFSELGSPVRGGGAQENSYKDIIQLIDLLMIFSLSSVSTRQMEKGKLGKHHELMGRARTDSSASEMKCKGTRLGGGNPGGRQLTPVHRPLSTQTASSGRLCEREEVGYRSKMANELIHKY